MPPKKKARLSSRAASTPTGNAVPHVEDTPTPMDDKFSQDDSVLDPWTDEQAISLFKSVVRWKPVGSFSYHVEEGGSLGRCLVLIFSLRHA